MVFDSQRSKPSSERRVTRPVGFRERKSGSLFAPYRQPASYRSKGTSSSPRHHSTFCTLTEFALPQTSITPSPSPRLQRLQCTGGRDRRGPFYNCLRTPASLST